LKSTNEDCNPPTKTAIHNEELTTSKEENASLNEELQTVNLELQQDSDFMLANSDMKTFSTVLEIATLFLDRELNVRRFTIN